MNVLSKIATDLDDAQAYESKKGVYNPRVYCFNSSVPLFLSPCILLHYTQVFLYIKKSKPLHYNTDVRKKIIHSAERRSSSL